MSDWFRQWADRHAAIFGLTSPQDLEMFAAWRGAFVSAGFTFSELNAATDWMVKQSAPEFRNEHLKMIQTFIRQRRDEQRRFEQQTAAPMGKSYCSLCGGTGMVVVPHPRFVIDGEWTMNSSYQPTAAVSCLCEVGKRIEQAQFNKERNQKLMSLGLYETRIPRGLWTALLHHKSKAAGANKKAEEATRAADKRGKVRKPAALAETEEAPAITGSDDDTPF